jgi:uncharacterized protein YdhG (YjbR/CyaY superfamily)
VRLRLASPRDASRRPGILHSNDAKFGAAARRTSAPMTSIDEYIAQMPQAARSPLRSVREAVSTAAPDARETISYGMPSFEQNGVTLVSFGAFKAHIGFYPGAAAIRTFAAELRDYGTAKGSVRFPLDQPMPIDIIRRIVRYKLAVMPN